MKALLAVMSRGKDAEAMLIAKLTDRERTDLSDWVTSQKSPWTRVKVESIQH